MRERCAAHWEAARRVVCRGGVEEVGRFIATRLKDLRGEVHYQQHAIVQRVRRRHHGV